jgi:hypothetical protein
MKAVCRKPLYAFFWDATPCRRKLSAASIVTAFLSVRWIPKMGESSHPLPRRWARTGASFLGAGRDRNSGRFIGYRTNVRYILGMAKDVFSGLMVRRTTREDVS